MLVEGANTRLSLVKQPPAEAYLPVKMEQQLPAKTASKSEQVTEQREISEAEVISAIEKANQKMQYYDTRLEFSIHEQTHQIMVKIFKNDEVVRELPPEKILDMVAKMMELAGLLVDEKV